MKNTKSALLFALTIFLASACATNYEEEKSVLLSGPESTDLVNQFDAEKQQEEIYKADQKEVVEAKKTNGKLKAAKPAPKKADTAPAKTPAVVSPKVSSVKATAFPADYPEE